MAFVGAAVAVGGAVGLGTGTAALIGGGALIGAGVGGLYSAVTGDGNILNSMLTGGLIGGAGAFGLNAAGVGGAQTAAAAKLPSAAASAPSTLAAPTSNVVTATPAMQAAANLEAAAVAEGATTAGMVPAANTGLAANTVLPASMTFTPPAPSPGFLSSLSGGQKLALGLGGVGLLSALGSRGQGKIQSPSQSPSYIRPYTYAANQSTATGVYPNPYATTQYDPMGNPILDTRERDYFDQQYTAQPAYQAAAGGLMAGGPVERMSANDMKPGMYPQGMMDKTYYSTPTQRPASMEVISNEFDAPMNSMTGLPPMRMSQGFAMGGDTTQYNLGSYSDGGRLLKGPGDGVSDDIPAMIGKKQPARLADGEFVIPARIVSEIGNGSTDAGAKRLYAMMDRVQAKRQKSAKKGKFAINTKAEKDLPA